MATRLFTPHLSLAEMACHDGTPYPGSWLETRGRVLARTFERVRAKLGEITGQVRAIEIGSCYRTLAHNDKIGGAKDSMHTYGLAIDLHTPDGVTVDQLHKAALDSMPESRGGVFVYPWGVHIDRRDYLGRKAARGDFRTPSTAGGE